MPKALAKGPAPRGRKLPPVITAGPARAEAKALVLDALREYLLSLQSEPVAGDGEREPVALTISA